jgi:hypothetical protein
MGGSLLLALIGLLSIGLGALFLMEPKIEKVDFSGLDSVLYRNKALYMNSKSKIYPFDCEEAANMGDVLNGTATVRITGIPILVPCTIDNRTVIQRIETNGFPTLPFTQGMETYKYPFGNVNSNFWLGLYNMYEVTKRHGYTLRIRFTRKIGRTTSLLRYKHFRLQVITYYNVIFYCYAEGIKSNTVVHFFSYKAMFPLNNVI